jgi:hypothetical protein
VVLGENRALSLTPMNSWAIVSLYLSGTRPARQAGSASCCQHSIAVSATTAGVHVQSGPDDRLALIRRYYQAYENDDRSTIEQLLHPGFNFTSPSPDDDRIDRTTYFERCWPPHKGIKSFALLDVCADDNGALVMGTLPFAVCIANLSGWRARIARRCRAPGDVVVVVGGLQ